MNAPVQEANHDVRTVAGSPSLLTPQEVADYLAVPVLTLQTWRASRKGPPAYRVGKHVRYRREEVDAWLEEHAATP